MNDFELELALVACVRREREATAEVLRYLREVEEREIHLKRGYSSMFAYCTGYLGYSEPEAQLRILAMRLIRAVPAAEERIERGELSLSVAAQIQGAVRREDLESTQALRLVEDLSGSSRRQAERKLAALFPESAPPERERPISADRVEIRFSVTAEEAALIRDLMDRRAHSNFERSHEKLYLDLVRKELKEKKINAPVLRPGKVTRFIPSAIRRAVWKRDEGCCQYRDPATGHRCKSKHGLQFDHIEPFSEGGSHDPENLRLYCGAHNRLRCSA